MENNNQNEGAYKWKWNLQVLTDRSEVHEENTKMKEVQKADENDDKEDEDTQDNNLYVSCMIILTADPSLQTYTRQQSVHLLRNNY